MPATLPPPPTPMMSDGLRALDQRLAARKPPCTLTLREHAARFGRDRPMTREMAAQLGYPPGDITAVFDQRVETVEGAKLTHVDGRTVILITPTLTLSLDWIANATEGRAALAGFIAGVEYAVGQVAAAVDTAAPEPAAMSSDS